MTNEDMIRAMPEEQLVALIRDSLDFFSCDECEKLWEDRPSLGCPDCDSWILKWLKSERQ